VNICMSPDSYEALKRSLSHIGFPMNDHPRFRKTGSVETLGSYLTRSAVAQILWASMFVALGGRELLVCWYAAIFAFAFSVREFNWRGHGAALPREKRRGSERHSRSKPLNQRLYGLTVGEWHENHHKYSSSANTALSPGQIDLAFQFIRLLALLGLVDSYSDAKRTFEETLSVDEAGTSNAARAGFSRSRTKTRASESPVTRLRLGNPR
jgi:stearoyl-CoA desaturase (delta-9 desaturase)